MNIPQTYGVDDIPLVIQSKEFDILKQIAIAGKMDTALFVNGTLDPIIMPQHKSSDSGYSTEAAYVHIILDYQTIKPFIK